MLLIESEHKINQTDKNQPWQVLAYNQQKIWKTTTFSFPSKSDFFYFFMCRLFSKTAYRIGTVFPTNNGPKIAENMPK
jgi:hypothetical protein